MDTTTKTPKACIGDICVPVRATKSGRKMSRNGSLKYRTNLTAISIVAAMTHGLQATG